MLMRRLRSKGTNEIKTNMSETELLNRLIKCKAIIEDTTEEEIRSVYNLKLKQPGKMKE